MPADHLLTSKEAADELGVGVSTLQRWAAAGLISPVWRTPRGRHARWDIDDLRRQLDISPAMPEPPVVAVAVVTSPLGVLAGKRNDRRPPWGFISGKIEPGESPADAAVREVKEETGLRIRPGNVIGRRVHPATDRTLVYVTARPLAGTDVHVGDPDELAEVRWLKLADAERLMPDMFPPVRGYLSRSIAARAAS